MGKSIRMKGSKKMVTVMYGGSNVYILTVIILQLLLTTMINTYTFKQPNAFIFLSKRIL